MRGLLFVLALALLGAVLWWQFAGEGAAAEPRPETPALDAAAQPAPAPTAVTDAAGTTTADRTAVDPAITASPKPADVIDYRLRFVAAGESTPLAGVETHWLDATFAWASVTAADNELRTKDPEAFLHKVGHRAVADGEGRLLLRASPASLNVVARLDQRYAEVWLSKRSALATDGPFAGEHVIALSVDHDLRIRTVDPQGQPVAGIVTNLTVRTGGRATSHAQQATDASGSAILKHCQRYSVDGQPVDADLRAQMVGDQGPPVPVDVLSPPAEPVDVPVPASGSIEVGLLGPDGRPWTVRAPGSLSVRLRPPRQAGIQIQGQGHDAPVGTDGRVLFSPVACGKTFEASAHGAFGSQTVAGPTRAGECVRVELRLPADTVIVTGRVLDPGRAPVAEVVTVIFETDNGMASHVLDRDETGRFCVPLQSHLGKQPAITFQQHRQLGQPMVGEAEVVLRGPLQAGINELGDIVLNPPPILCAGTVRMADGSAPQGVRPELERARPGEHPNWQGAWDLPVRVDEQGRFEVLALPRGLRYRLQVRGATPVPPVEFAPGTTDLAIVLGQGGGVTATFLLDAAVRDDPMDGLEFRLVPVAARAGKGTSRDFGDEMRQRGWPRADGERTQLRWTGLAAGPHRLLAICPGVENLVDLEVAVPPGGEATDARLRDIDLRGRVRRIMVRVTDRSSTTAGGSRVLLRGDEQQREWFGRELPPGDTEGAKFWVTRPVDVVVVAAGCRGQVLPAVFADTTVALDAAPTVTLHWSAASTLPADVRATLSWTRPRVRGQPETMARFSRGGGGRTGSLERELLGDATECALTEGRATLRAECPLPIQIRLSLSKKGKREQGLPLQPEQHDLSTLADGHVVELSCDPAALQRALTTLAGN